MTIRKYYEAEGPIPHTGGHTPEQRGVDVHDQLAYIIDDLSKAHDLLARTYLTNEKYNPISNILAKSKLSLADVLIKLSAILLPSKGQEGEAERKAREIYDKCYHEIEEATAGLFEEDVPYIEARKKAAKATALICVGDEIDLVDRLLNSRLNNDFDLLAERGELYKVRTIIVNL